MIASDFEDIVRLYAIYGFQQEESGEGYTVFSLIESIFPGVDILVDSNDIAERIKSKYSEEGYSTNIIEYKNLSALDLNLYKRVLNPKLAKKNLKAKYNNYIKKILTPYKRQDNTYPEYQYIKSSYQWEHQFKRQMITEPLLDILTGIIAKSDARLIIVEAPAGFGKTSTSFELLKRLCDTDDSNRPFMMELERERQATTFRYLLLSQIDRQFGANRKSDLIIENIKKGRIPLIIDGFDELLSKDLDNGKEKFNFKAVETMLSTIAALLTDKAKVVLTTRKTAIFSGTQFTEWIEYQRDINRRDFKVDRFQLMEPTPSDWLDDTKLSHLPQTLSKISNPTLLSFLRYSDDWLYTKQVIDPAQLVEKYFSTLYLREKERQDIQLKATSQEKIMRDIAALFCIFDITADQRTSIKNFIYESNQDIIDAFTDNSDNQQELLNKLVNHALLDRHESGLIGFVNDFVYGTLLYKALVNDCPILKELEEMSNSNADKVIEASEILTPDEKLLVAQTLKKCPGISSEILFKIDHRLLNAITENYSGLYLSDYSFIEIDFCNKGLFNNTSFVQCRFENCRFNLNNFDKCFFINCDFKNVEFFGNNDSNDYYECSGLTFIKEYPINEESEVPEHQDDLYIQILKMFKRAGSESTRIRHISGIISELEPQYGRKIIMKHLSKLKSKEYIYVNGDNAWLLQNGSDYLKNN